uniref:NADH-ubiquinone oxidoreductase chain 3 n=1 Tax=Bisetocreagris titanium TaxID=2836860 RepID=A0A8F7KMG5_9ARAC|nr:NADH dehydrogenase subunit 3 [Bisetocreagris titanium]
MSVVYFMFYILETTLVIVILSLLSFLISLNSLPGYDKLTPYESGFEFIEKTYNSFSLQFFLISIIFIVFDMEIMLLIPIPLMWGTAEFNSSCYFFFTLLMLGYGYEWLNKSLNWK